MIETEMNIDENIKNSEAEKRLLAEYERVMGQAPDGMVEIICEISAARAASGEKWRWVKDESNPHWGAQLHWG